jgi:hypothetical protein
MSGWTACLPFPRFLPGSVENESSLHNAYYARPAMLALAGDVAGDLHWRGFTEPGHLALVSGPA